ncbi:hypothetical protein GAPWK_1721 [Gilliamella apicola]|nr:hypothetical protein GAPWK_1721 [Gilliamella apicola]
MKVFLVNLLNTKISIDEQLIEIIDFFYKMTKENIKCLLLSQT